MIQMSVLLCVLVGNVFAIDDPTGSEIVDQLELKDNGRLTLNKNWGVIKYSHHSWTETRQKTGYSSYRPSWQKLVKGISDSVIFMGVKKYKGFYETYIDISYDFGSSWPAKFSLNSEQAFSHFKYSLNTENCTLLVGTRHQRYPGQGYTETPKVIVYGAAFNDGKPAVLYSGKSTNKKYYKFLFSEWLLTSQELTIEGVESESKGNWSRVNLNIALPAECQ